MSTTTNGAHVEVTVREGDPLTVTPDEPPPDQYAREYVSANGFAFGLAVLGLFFIVVGMWIVTHVVD